MTNARVPFNLPSIEGREIDLIRQAVENGHLSASGPLSAQASSLLRETHDAADVLLTTSCTDALEMAAMLLDRRPGDTVIVPSFTFVSSALAFAREGFGIVFADIEAERLGVDPEHLVELVDETTRAVVVVHYGGIAADMDGIREAIGGRQVEIIEDNAHGLFATRGGQTLGTLGRFSTLSFHETKNFSCGEGGALIVNDLADVDRAHVIHDKGTDRRAFMLGQVDKYSWKDTGSSFALSELNAAFLLGQLEQRNAILAKRRGIFEAYVDLLEPIAAEHGLRLPVVPPDCEPGYHLFYVLFPDRPTRDHVLRALRAVDITAVFHYVPLHNSHGALRFRSYATDCPRSESTSERLLRMPYFNSLQLADIERVAAAVDAALR